MAEEKKESTRVIVTASIVFIVVILISVAMAIWNVWSWWWVLGTVGFVLFAGAIFLILYLTKLRKIKSVEIEEEKFLSEDEIKNQIFTFARQNWIEPYPIGMEMNYISTGSPPTHMVYTIFKDMWDSSGLPIAIILDIKDKRKSIVMSKVGNKIKTQEEFINDVKEKIYAMAKRPTLVGTRKLKTYRPETGTMVEESEEIPAEELEKLKEKKAEEERKGI